jgi:hypothetical protein
MGIRLVREILDHYHGPDVRKLWLLSWAENANDRSRTGWPGRSLLSHRTGKSPSRVSHIADELVAEGVLKRDGGGNRGGRARFVLLPLAHDEKGADCAHPFEDCEDGESDAMEPCEEQGKGAARTHPKARGKGAARTHPQPEIKGADSKEKGAESSRKGADSIALPAETGPLPLIEPSVKQPSDSARADAPTAQTILGSFIDWVRANGGELTGQTKGRLAKQIGALLNEGTPDRHIRKGLADWFIADKNVSLLDSFVNAAATADARARLAREAGGNRASPQRGHKTYKNPSDDSVYEEPI